MNEPCFVVLIGGGQLPNLLQEATIPVITEQRCDEKWLELDYDVISDIHVCVWDEVNQDKGSCNVCIAKLFEISRNFVVIEITKVLSLQ